MVQAISRFDPKVGKQIPKDFEADLITVSKGDAAAATARIAHDVRVLGVVLPIVALLLFAGAVLLAPVRMAAVTRDGLAVAAVGALVVIGMIVPRELLLGRADSDTDRAALGVIRDAFGHDLRNWNLLLLRTRGRTGIGGSLQRHG